MKFIKLTKNAGNETVINAQHITSIEVDQYDTTWIELINGNKFTVEELAEDILSSINCDLV